MDTEMAEEAVKLVLKKFYGLGLMGEDIELGYLEFSAETLVREILMLCQGSKGKT